MEQLGCQSTVLLSAGDSSPEFLSLPQRLWTQYNNSCKIRLIVGTIKIIALPWPAWLSWFKGCLMHQRVMGPILGQDTCPGFRLILGWGTHWRQPIHVSLTLSLSKSKHKEKDDSMAILLVL